MLEFSAHPLLQPLTVDLSKVDEFEFVLLEVNAARPHALKLREAWKTKCACGSEARSTLSDLRCQVSGPELV